MDNALRTPRARAQALLISTLTLAAAPAAALQPLGKFLDGAGAKSPDLREAEANLTGQQDQEQASLGHLLPALNVRGSYIRNQYAADLNLDLAALNGPLMLSGPKALPDFTAVIQPYNQINSQATINIPLVDLASLQRYRQGSLGTESAEESEKATALQVQAQVVQSYYQLVANLAVVTTAQKALDVDRANLQTTSDKLEAGTASQLDVDRANAEVERGVQQVAAAHLSVVLAQRTLETLSGVSPELTAVPIEDDLHAEAGLDQWAPPDTALPSIQSAALARENSEKTVFAQKLQLAPTLSGNLNAYYQNFLGLTGHETYLTAGLALTWNVDYTTWSTIHVQEAQLAVAQAREERARLAARDAIFRFWSTVQSDLELSRSARVQAKVSDHAADLAEDRYKAGVATQLDLLQAQRDAFAAEVTRIEADADLINARAQLRLAAGRPYAGGSAP